jgi:hypothetical protein
MAEASLTGMCTIPFSIKLFIYVLLTKLYQNLRSLLAYLDFEEFPGQQKEIALFCVVVHVSLIGFDIKNWCMVLVTWYFNFYL